MRALSILAAIAFAAACSSEAENEANLNQLPPGQREAQIGQVGFRYDSNRLVIEQVQVPLPNDAERQVRGAKLIARERQDALDKGRCPDLPGRICRAESEGGLTLTVLNKPFAEISDGVRRTRPTTVAGREGVTWDGRFGERPATFTLLPVDQQTLLMIRQTEGEGAPDAATLDAVLATLTLGPAAGEPAAK